MPRNPFSLENKVVCLVGGTGLIGRALIDPLVALGAKVIVGSRKSISKEDSSETYQVIDIKNEESIKNFINSVILENKRIDVWINCALPDYKYSNDSWDTIASAEVAEDLEAHLLGYYNSTRHVLKSMMKQENGSIINFGSIYGELSPDFKIYEQTEVTRLPTYSLAKSGIHMMTKYFAVVAAPQGVRVNTVASGGVFNDHSPRFVSQYSDRVPMGRMGQPEDLVGPVLFLASDGSSYMTGQTMFIDGGLSAQ